MDEKIIFICTKCKRDFTHDESLETFADGRGGFFSGCPVCKTDDHLKDLDYAST